jgi:hypothetical protein
MLNYFISNRLKNLMESIGEFWWDWVSLKS